MSSGSLIIKEGFLLKPGKHNKSALKKRWYVLQRNLLMRMDKPPQGVHRSQQKAKESISISSCATFTSNSNPLHPYGIIIRTAEGKIIELFAKDNAEAQQWSSIIQSASAVVQTPEPTAAKLGPRVYSNQLPPPGGAKAPPLTTQPQTQTITFSITTSMPLAMPAQTMPMQTTPAVGNIYIIPITQIVTAAPIVLPNAPTYTPTPVTLPSAPTYNPARTYDAFTNSYSSPPYTAQPYPAQPYSAPPYSAQPYSAQPYSAPAYSEMPYTPAKSFSALSALQGAPVPPTADPKPTSAPPAQSSGYHYSPQYS